MFFGLFSIYNKFKYKNWARMNEGQRQKAIEKVEKKQAKKLERPVLPVVVNTDPNWHCYGMFENGHGRQLLHISIKLLTDPALRFHALETILHEGRHAYQFNIINKKKLGLFDFKKKRWKQNYSGYISSREDKLIYSMQPIERDAQKYAIKQMDKLYGKFKNERDYHNTLKSMIYRYEETEKQVREKHGLFYKLKILNKIKNKTKRKF